jgi:acyl phosphate:glycerol-3-phosphate acyltransferase
MLEFILLLIAAYVIGSIPTAYVVVKWYRGKDIRLYGSGQVGGSNVFRSFSKPLGIAVGLYDLAKGVILVLIANLLGMDIVQQVAIGLAVVIGHNWPVFLKFNAGRGLATTVGIIFYLQYEFGILPWGIIVFAVIAATFVLVGGTPLPTLIAVGAQPVVSWWFHEPLALTLGIAALFLVLPIRRVTAPKSSQAASISNRELFFNRLLFDRDIRDGKSWIFSRPPETAGKEKMVGKREIKK